MLRAIAIVLCAIGLSGCASFKPGRAMAPEPGGDARVQAWSARREALAALPGFGLSGRAALQSAGEGWSARLDWQQGPAAWTMELSGPFNQGTLRLAGGNGKVRLESGSERVEAASLEALLGERLGWRIPLESLRFWVLGLPAPQWPIEDLRLDAAGRLTDVRQGPWRLSVLAYMDDAPLALPRRVYVNGEAAELRLVVQSWEASP
jgi:outer membrane lipoprotein LolB